MNGNINGTWKIMNTLLNKRITSLSLYFVNNDELIQNEQTIANEFISYFSFCCSTLHYNIARIDSLSIAVVDKRTSLHC